MCRLQKFMDIFWKDKGPSPQPHDPPPPSPFSWMQA